LPLKVETPLSRVADVLNGLPSVAAWQERVYKDLHAHPERARAAGRVEQDIPVNHSEFFASVIEPTLSMGTQALVVAALAYLAK
jgi:hypothetical protein